MDEREARARLAGARVARLATVTPDLRPHVVPCTFALLGSAVVTVVDDKPKRTLRLQRLANVAANPHVAVLADRYSDDWSTLWWVRADGEGTVVEGGERHRTAVAALAGKYEQYAERSPTGPVIWIEVHRWTGWASAPHAGPGATPPTG
ncbi:MAG: TIGR03668 family PPOX class F420-dependent oxidoreductase [Mycobacterium leprae]